MEDILDRVVRWTDADLRIHLLGWLTTRTDDQIQEETVELVGALENVAYTSTITKMGEDIMTNVVELCTMLTNKGPANLTTINMKDTGAGQHHQHQPEEETEKDDWGTPSQPSQSTPATPPSERAGPRRGVSCNTSNLHERMPRPMIWASPGGIAPIEPSKGLDTNIDCTDKDHTMARRTTPTPAKEPEQVYPVGGDQGQQHQPQGEQEEGDHQHPSHLGQMPQGEGE